jgi:hypothetical protein
MRELNELQVRCTRCLKTRDASALLTGFDSALIKVGDDTPDGDFRRVLSEVLHNTRMVLNALSEEVSDCPRLFTVSAKKRAKMVNIMDGRESLEIHLWCEEPGHEHPVSEAYSFRPDKEWLEELSPYLKYVAILLRTLVPIATAGFVAYQNGAVSEGLAAKLALMDQIASSIPGNGGPNSKLNGSSMPAIPSARNAAGLRAFRRLLFELDPERHFGGLARVMSPAGDYRFVCDEHLIEYDPGMPQMPS